MAVKNPVDYDLNRYDYELPQELIAMVPSGMREQSRLLVLDRAGAAFDHRTFDRIGSCLKARDLLVINDTRVVPARLVGRKDTGGRVELLVTDPYKPADRAEEEGYCCLVKSSKRPARDSLIELRDGIVARIASSPVNGTAFVKFSGSQPLLEILSRIGEVPLPPYIRQEERHTPFDDSRAYQTVYARKPGAVAAPTAGLHFSAGLLDRLLDMGVRMARITLHVGYGTFAPIRVSDVREHLMHPEYIEVEVDSAATIEEARKKGERIVAVGTTVVRTLEWLALEFGRVIPYSGLCNHYIYPGYRFRVVDAMITNFHLPRSTLLLLVSAFAGRNRILEAYREAIRQRYRFFSYGDAMLIL
ncbi:MAG: tRNA preQ1(34) S-adenosylmethionine ribosyltransferase-isomerase QueA [Syntrophobacteraceae bacterium]|nr:tRNA preQ1(34) S-adenosylmethionine ribosyltransferase-isomerase QueA [Syntrophobacteraceae bacterium]